MSETDINTKCNTKITFKSALDRHNGHDRHNGQRLARHLASQSLHILLPR